MRIASTHQPCLLSSTAILYCQITFFQLNPAYVETLPGDVYISLKQPLIICVFTLSFYLWWGLGLFYANCF